MVADPSAADAIIAACHAATEANLKTPWRKGNVVDIPRMPGGALYVAGDLHGDRAHYDRVCSLAGLADHPNRHLVLQEVCHGGPTYPDSTADMSHKLLEEVIRLKSAFPNQFHFLLSNHELSELTDHPIVKGGRMLNLQFRYGLHLAYGSRAEEVRSGYMQFIASCPMAIRLGRIFISHSLPSTCDLRGFDCTCLERQFRDVDVMPSGDVYRLVWGRDFRPQNAEAFCRLIDADVLIHGHEPCVDGYQVPNDRQVILDGQGPRGTYAVLPTDRPLNHADVVACVRRIEGA